MTDYYRFRDSDVTCPACGWHGHGADTVQLDLMDFGTEQGCPTCNRLLAITVFPTSEEALTRLDVPEHDRVVASFSLSRQKDFERRSLKRPDELPELHPSPETLIWDQVGEGWNTDAVVRHGDIELWREPSFYEHMDRLYEVAAILKSRYPTLRRIEYTDAVWRDLMGDKHTDEEIQRLNERLADSSG